MTETRGGWVCLHRSLAEHPLMTQLPAAWLRVFIAILLRANWKVGIWWNGEREIQMQPGQLITSVDKLSKISKVSVKQVRGCLQYLAAANTAAIETTSRYTVITLLKWEDYQNPRELEGKPEGTLDGEVGASRGQSKGKVGATIEQRNNTTREYMSNSGELDGAPKSTPQLIRKPRALKGEIDPDIRSWFESEFWPIYPRHEAKAPTLEAAGKKATTPERRAFYLERLNTQLPEYNRRKAESGQRVIPLGSTWFNQNRADDELPVQSPEPLPRRGNPEIDYPEYESLEAGR